jgi:hypothetical protein
MENLDVFGEWEPVGGGRVKGEGEGRVNMIEVLHIHV